MTEYKEILPSNCPSPEAIKQEIVLFRIVKNETLDINDFEPYTKMYPNKEEYKLQCKAHALSFFTNLERAKRTFLYLQKKNYDKGNFILEVKIKPDHGKIEINEKSSHCSMWLFKDTDITKFDVLNIYKDIAENEN